MFARALGLQETFLSTKSILGGSVSHALPKGHSLLACIDLTEAKTHFHTKWDKEDKWMLPDDGQLIFTIDFNDLPLGLDVSDKDKFSVQHIHNTETHLQGSASAPSLNGPSLNDGYGITFVPFVSLPSSQRMDDGENENHYDDFVQDLEKNVFKGPRHQIMGYPIPIQNDDFEDESASWAQKAFQSTSFPESWVLLAQFDSDDKLGWMFGDMGTLYFMINKQDLAHKNFQKVWMVFQCC